MTYKIRVSREWGCSPLGGPAVSFPAGEYAVPEQMSDYLAQRCIRSGIGTLVEPPGNDGREVFHPKKRAPHNKAKGAAPENKRLDS